MCRLADMQIGFFICTSAYQLICTSNRPRSTMDSIRVSEAPDPGSIPGEATNLINRSLIIHHRHPSEKKGQSL